MACIMCIVGPMIYFAIWVMKLFDFPNIINETNMIDY